MKMKPGFPRKILVVGAGAVGGYFGAQLTRAGLDITFLLRPVTCEVVSQKGLRITSTEGDFSVKPQVISELSAEDHFDLIILAIKCPDVAALLPKLSGPINKGACLLTLQNGVSTEDQIWAAYPKAILLAGVAYITARRASPTRIIHSCGGMIALGELSGEKSERARAVEALFVGAGLRSKLRSNIRRAKWVKLCWNATFNPLTVILDAPISVILDDPALLELVRSGMSEVIAVAESEGVFLDQKIIEQSIEASEMFRDFYSSMYEDFKSGKKSEIDFLNGELVRRGRARGIATPTHTMLWALVNGLEKRAGR